MNTPIEIHNPFLALKGADTESLDRAARLSVATFRALGHADAAGQLRAARQLDSGKPLSIGDPLVARVMHVAMSNTSTDCLPGDRFIKSAIAIAERFGIDL